MAIQPVRWPALKDMRAVLLSTWREAGEDNVSFLAAAVAFYAFLAFVPLLASLVLVYGLVAEPQTVGEHVRALFDLLPSDAASLVGDQLRTMTESPDGAKGGALVVAIGIALYGASKGAGAVVTALNIAYQVKDERGFIQATLLSLAMTLGALAVLIMAAGAVAAMGWVEALFPALPDWGQTALRLLSWALAAVAAGIGTAAVYRFAPNRPDAPWVWISPGSAAATCFWLIASLGFGLYVSRFGNYNATYGSLGGVVVFLTWLYLSAYILLMGGELNSELERQQAGGQGEALPEAPEAAEQGAPSDAAATDQTKPGWAFALVGLLLIVVARPARRSG